MLAVFTESIGIIYTCAESETMKANYQEAVLCSIQANERGVNSCIFGTRIDPKLVPKNYHMTGLFCGRKLSRMFKNRFWQRKLCIFM